MEMVSWQDLSEFEMEHVEFFLDEKQGNTQKRYFIGVQKKKLFQKFTQNSQKNPRDRVQNFESFRQQTAFRSPFLSKNYVKIFRLARLALPSIVTSP